MQTNCKLEDALAVHNGKGYSLFKQGFSFNKWLLINEEVFYCVLRPCQEGELLYNDSCVNISHHSLYCISEILYVEFSGEKHYDCLPHFYVYNPKAGICIAENDQESCPDSQILEKDSNHTFQWIGNPCKTDDLVHNPEKEICYKKLYKGPWKKENRHEVILYNANQAVTCDSVQS